MILNDKRSTILAYNSVERLLKGDYFHFTRTEDVICGLSSFDPKWPILGVGTTNWYRRNGEAIVEGTTSESRFLWADPNSEPVGKIVDLLGEKPDCADDLRSPYLGEDESKPQFPFLAIAVCNPRTERKILVHPGDNIHKRVIDTLSEDNIGLAAIGVSGSLERVKSTAAYHLPLGGVTLDEGYEQGDTFRFNEVDSGTWRLQGVFAVNPTIQAVLSVPGIPLHLHGYEIEKHIGGHINQAIATQDCEIRLYPIQDINICIRDLDQAILPFKYLE